jgi:alkyl sulfatase BDS1-like metallo-beta-lactamase superfamily hydrolase
VLDGGRISVIGNASPLKELLSMLDTFDFWFNIATPVNMPNQ